MKILITGNSGYIGSHLTDLLLKKILTKYTVLTRINRKFNHINSIIKIYETSNGQ